jgi:hypothetical protein
MKGEERSGAWADLVAAARDRFAIDREGEGWFALRWTAASGATAQPQLVRAVERQGRTWVEIVCVVSGLEGLSERQFLERGAALRVGHPLLVAGLPCVCEVVPLAQLGIDELQRRMSVLAAAAVALRAGSGAPAHLFQHFAE